MADSTAVDYTKMKVIELRRELKSRGLLTTGDKAELIARLQNADFLDSDEIDSDGVLEDDLKSNHDLLLDESAALADDSPLESASPDKPPPPKPKVLKRKISESVSIQEEKPKENQDTAAKKITLNRQTSIETKTLESITKESVTKESKPAEKVKISVDLDAKSKLELRAKRFGLTSDAERKEARKQRFGAALLDHNTTAEEAEKLKKRAERFGECVSNKLTALTNEEKLQKRAQKFGLVK